MDIDRAVEEFVNASIPETGAEAERVREELAGHLFAALERYITHGMRMEEAFGLAVRKLGSLKAARAWVRRAKRRQHETEHAASMQRASITVSFAPTGLGEERARVPTLERAGYCLSSLRDYSSWKVE